MWFFLCIQQQIGKCTVIARVYFLLFLFWAFILFAKFLRKKNMKSAIAAKKKLIHGLRSVELRFTNPSTAKSIAAIK